jgi:alkylation response protein AidB-like acyl-CoA dehydrogenase
MDIAFTPAQQAWRQEVIEFLSRELTPDFVREFEREDAASSYASPTFSRKLAERGWLTLHWPREYGGLERPFMDQAILNEQLGYFRAPVGWHNIATEWVALPLMQYGTQEQKQRFLPAIARAEVSYSPTLSEPEAGSDLANIKTTAVRDGEEYVVNGLKVFITPAHRARYLWLLVVTDPQAARRHQRMSMLIVPVDTPGITIKKVPTMNHGRVNDVYLEDVRVPVANRVGPEHGGWQVAMTTLNIERSGIYYVSANQMWLEDLVQYARETRRRGRPIIEDPLVRHRLAYWATELEAQRMLSWRIAWLQSQGKSPSTEASIQSLRVRMYEHEFANFGMQVLGQYGQLGPDSRWAPLRGRIEKLYLSSSAQHAGGTTEIQKNIVALHGLGLPRN